MQAAGEHRIHQFSSTAELYGPTYVSVPRPFQPWQPLPPGLGRRTPWSGAAAKATASAAVSAAVSAESTCGTCYIVQRFPGAYPRTAPFHSHPGFPRTQSSRGNTSCAEGVHARACAGSSRWSSSGMHGDPGKEYRGPQFPIESVSEKLAREQ